MPAVVLSVIIPTLNEAEQLPALLDDLAAQADVALEIIVGDGGSSDRTGEIAAERGIRVVSAGRGRGRQMNAAARQARGEQLLFLHADSRLDNPQLLATAVATLDSDCARMGNDSVAGHFRLRFVRSRSGHERAYRYAEGKSAFNRVNTTNGDQGLLLSRAFFERIGGFDESLPFLEDQQLAERIRCCGRLITLPGELYTSARRFEAEGFHRRYILMSMIMGLYNIGARSFFERAPGVYKAQGETGQLLLSPYFAIVRQIMREEWGVWGSVVAFYRLGRYIRSNSWQLFYFFDVWAQPLLAAERYPCVTFHDRFVAPFTDRTVCNAVVGLLTYVWFMVVLTLYFWLVDRWQTNGRVSSLGK